MFLFSVLRAVLLSNRSLRLGTHSTIITCTHIQSDSFDRLEIQFDFAAQTFPPNGSLAHFTILIIENDLGERVCMCLCVCVIKLAHLLVSQLTPFGRPFTQTFSPSLFMSSRFLASVIVYQMHIHCTPTHASHVLRFQSMLKQFL